MSTPEYHPDVVQLIKNGRKPVYLNDLEIGHASSWADVTCVLATFAVRLFGSRYACLRNKVAVQIRAVQDLEAMVGKKLFFPREAMAENAENFRLKF